MKPILLITMLMFAAPSEQARAASVAPSDYPSGIAEIEWDTGLAEAKKLLLLRPGVKLISEGADKLTFAGGTFADQTVERWELFFVGGKFREGKLRLKPEEPLRQYEALRKLIAAKYRKPGREERENAVHRATYWDYPSSKGKLGIACDTNTDGITLVYKFTPAGPAASQPKPKDI